MSSASPPVRLSVVTATRAGSVRLPELIRSLHAQDITAPWEWVVVLDGVTDQTPWVLETLARGLPVREVRPSQSRGVAHALAAGYDAARGSIILRCDDDLTLPPHLLSGHLGWHDSTDEELGVISLTRDAHDSRFGTAYGRGANEALIGKASACPAEQRWRHWAACNSVRRAAYDGVGGFDTSLSYREDSDLGYRLSRAGVSLVVDPRLEVTHRGSFTRARDRVERAFLSGASLRVFETTHPETKPADEPPGAWSRLVAVTSRAVPSPSAAKRLGAAVDHALPVLPDTYAEKVVALAVEAAGAAGHARGRAEWTRPPTVQHRSAVDRVAARLAARPGPLDRLAGSVVSVTTEQPEFVLTYDDGPTPGVTDKLLDVLDRHAQSATFFVLANRAAASPNLLREVAAAGHEIAVHGLDHQPLTRFSAGQVFRRTEEARARIEEICERPMLWFRPPYGAQGLRAWSAIQRTGLRPVLWSASFNEHEDHGHEECLRQALDSCDRGAVVLAHDGHAGPLDGVDDGPEPTLDRVRLTDEFLTRIRERGLSAVSLGTALARGTADERAWLRS